MILSAVGKPVVLPVADTQTIVKGSADATKLLRFEVDGFTAGATRVLTPPNADATIAGLEVANVFTAIQKINVDSALALLVEQDGVKDNVLVVNTNTARVGINRTPSVAGLDVLDPSNAAIRIGDSIADTTAKKGRFLVPNYTNADGSTVVFGAQCGVATNVIGFGGGLSSFNTATQMGFYAAATSAIKTGTEIARITTTGVRVEPSGVAAAASTPLHTLTVDAVTNAVTNILTIGHNSTGTPAASFGTGVLIQGESSTTENQSLGRLTYEWATATHASRKALGKLTVYDTAEREAIRIEASGTAPMLGVLGAAAVARQAHIADPAGGGTQDAEARTAINAILVVLENFGFTATS